MKIRTIILWVLFFTVIDQSVKAVIDGFFMHSGFEIIPPFLIFLPTFNYNYSYVNDLLSTHSDFSIGLIYHVAFIVVMQGVIIGIYRHYRSRNMHTKFLDWGFVFFEAGYTAAFIEYFWNNGCLDYLYLKPLFVFDLKDLYINCFILLFLVHAYKISKRKSIDRGGQPGLSADTALEKPPK